MHSKTVIGVIRSTFVVDGDETIEHSPSNVTSTGHVAKLRRVPSCVGVRVPPPHAHATWVPPAVHAEAGPVRVAEAFSCDTSCIVCLRAVRKSIAR